MLKVSKNGQNKNLSEKKIKREYSEHSSPKEHFAGISNLKSKYSERGSHTNHGWLNTR